MTPPPDCRPLAGLDRVVALFAYEGAGRSVIGALKFRNHRDVVAPMASMLAAAIDAPVDLVTWVPTSARHRRERGYDQGELLARSVASSLGVRARPTVRRRTGAAQTGAGRSLRLERARFVARRPVTGQVVAVVDDVRTTGASLVGVAAALRSAGARSVIGATFAATP